MRFYGGTRDHWLDTPVADIDALIMEIASVRAEESMEAATVVAAGTGSLKKEDAKSVWREWKRALGIGKRKMSKDDLGAAMAASGIKVVK
jgi:hypothetical protein